LVNQSCGKQLYSGSSNERHSGKSTYFLPGEERRNPKTILAHNPKVEEAYGGANILFKRAEQTKLGLIQDDDDDDDDDDDNDDISL
jgi:hypothetical protein